MAGESHTTLKTTSVNVPNKKGAVMWAFVKGFDSEAAKPHQPDDRCGSRGLNFGFTQHVDGQPCECSVGVQFSPGYWTLVLYCWRGMTEKVSVMLGRGAKRRRDLSLG